MKATKKSLQIHKNCRQKTKKTKKTKPNKKIKNKIKKKDGKVDRDPSCPIEFKEKNC